MQFSNLYKKNLSYIVGIAIGDGNLSNPNGRATRLRISCDIKYKKLLKNIIASLKKVFPNNKVSIVKRPANCTDISCYSNQLEDLLGWEAKGGSKIKQKISIPKWIRNNRIFTLRCLKGLFETDGSIYFDRKYQMANFTTAIPTLSQDVLAMITKLGFKPNLQIHRATDGRIKHTIRISKRAKEFIRLLKIDKS